MTTGNGVRAVVWDYDGTLANTWERNLDVTRDIVETILREDPDTFWPLQSLDQYSKAMTQWINWRDFYSQGLGLSEDEIDRVGPYWSPFQLKNTSGVRFYDDATDTLRAADVPQGIVSQNAKNVIAEELARAALLKHFDCIIGYEEVPLRRQKPHPDGLLLCLQTLIGSTPGSVLFVGDHETDVQCAMNANRLLTANGSNQIILSVLFLREGNAAHTDWAVRPDFIAKSSRDIIELIKDSASV